MHPAVFPIYGGVDGMRAEYFIFILFYFIYFGQGFSKAIVSMEVVSNNSKPQEIAPVFIRCIEKFGFVPRLVP